MTTIHDFQIDLLITDENSDRYRFNMCGGSASILLIGDPKNFGKHYHMSYEKLIALMKEHGESS